MTCDLVNDLVKHGDSPNITHTTSYVIYAKTAIKRDEDPMFELHPIRTMTSKNNFNDKGCKYSLYQFNDIYTIVNLKNTKWDVIDSY